MTFGGEDRPIPGEALLLSLVAMALPVVCAFNAPGWMEGDLELLLWLTALVPAFLLTFYKGWTGVSISLALGMVAITLTQVILLLLGAPPPNWRLLLAVIVVFVGVSLGLGYFADRLARERAKAEAQALTDSLTGLPNRRHADVFLDAAFSGADRGMALAVVLFDLDHFKDFNDTHGHAAGDEILRGFSSLLDNSTRRMDLSARFGGEEFISILTHCDLGAAVGFADRVRSALAGTAFPWGRVTVSAGVAAFEAGMGTSDLLVAAADQALYQAKEEGRDRVAFLESAIREVAAVTPSPPTPLDASSADGVILVVDDDPQVGRALARLVASMGYSATVFTDPEKALVHLSGSSDEVSLLLVDVIMPTMNGLTFVDRVSRIRSDLPVVYMSGFIHGGGTWPGVSGAGTAFLRKPFSVAELQSTVQRFLPSQDEVPPVVST